MIELKPCPICGKQPSVFTTAVSASGCDFSAYIVECDADNDGTQTPPFVEHSLSVYGKNETEAKERWNKIGANPQ